MQSTRASLSTLPQMPHATLYTSVRCGPSCRHRPVKLCASNSRTSGQQVSSEFPPHHLDLISKVMDTVAHNDKEHAAIPTCHDSCAVYLKQDCSPPALQLLGTGPGPAPFVHLFQGVLLSNKWHTGQ